MMEKEKGGVVLPSISRLLRFLLAAFLWSHFALTGCSYRYFYFSVVNVSRRAADATFRRNDCPFTNCFSHFASRTANGDDLDSNSSSQQQINSVRNIQEEEKQGTLKAPTFNGKVVYPVKAFLAGLARQAPVAAVYAILNSEYKRG